MADVIEPEVCVPTEFGYVLSVKVVENVRVPSISVLEISAQVYNWMY